MGSGLDWKRVACGLRPVDAHLCDMFEHNAKSVDATMCANGSETYPRRAQSNKTQEEQYEINKGEPHAKSARKVTGTTEEGNKSRGNRDRAPGRKMPKRSCA